MEILPASVTRHSDITLPTGYMKLAIYYCIPFQLKYVIQLNEHHLQDKAFSVSKGILV
jgi:hypothetical protein